MYEMSQGHPVYVAENQVNAGRGNSVSLLSVPAELGCRTTDSQASHIINCNRYSV
jgi:hypothetical protein